MIRRPPRSTQSRSSAASDVYKRQGTFRVSLPDTRWPESRRLLCGRWRGLWREVGRKVLSTCTLVTFRDIPASLRFVPPAGSRWWPGGAMSVSYTHLRAHETDSYLVCRLLLEKKKKHKNILNIISS